MSEELWYPSTETNQVVGRFEYFKQLDVAASKEADEERFRTITIVRSRVVGMVGESDVSIKLTPANQGYWLSRFPKAWEAFQTGAAPPVEGTLLTDESVKLAGLDPRKVMELKVTGVLTVEQLAGLSDAQAGAVFGHRNLRKNAQDFLAARAAAADTDRQRWITAQMTADKMPAAEAAKAEPPKNKGGRPFGSKNKPKDQAAA